MIRRLVERARRLRATPIVLITHGFVTRKQVEATKMEDELGHELSDVAGTLLRSIIEQADPARCV